MSPLDTDTMVALRIDEIVREQERSRLGWQACHNARLAERASPRDALLWHQQVSRTVGTLLIRVGVWLSGGTPVSTARG